MHSYYNLLCNLKHVGNIIGKCQCICMHMPKNNIHKFLKYSVNIKSNMPIAIYLMLESIKGGIGEMH